MIEPKLYRNDQWMVPCKVGILYMDLKSQDDHYHSFNTGPMGK
jgi:hypothetical protein